MSKRVTVPSFSVISINISTVTPVFLPLSLIFIRASKRTVTLTASILDSVTVLVTDAELVTAAFTATSVSISLTALIKVWFDVPKRGLNITFWKLKSVFWTLLAVADGLTTGVLSKNTSLRAALL